MENTTPPYKKPIYISGPFLTVSLEMRVEPQKSGCFCFCLLKTLTYFDKDIPKSVQMFEVNKTTKPIKWSPAHILQTQA